MKTYKSHELSSRAGYVYSWISMIMVVAVCLFIIVNVWWQGHDMLSFRFLFTDPNASAISAEAGGILSPLVGTVLLTLIGMLIAFPISLATAIYLCFYARNGWAKSAIKMAIDVLSGVPTIVIALFGLSIFTMPWLSFLSTPVETVGEVSRAYGKSFLVAGMTMAVMVLPFVIKSIEETLKSVPESYIEGSLAMGATKWRTISKVVLQAARQGVVTGVILGMGRIVGDTAIVWLTLGGTLRMTGIQPWYAPQNWLSTLQNTGSTLTSYIYYTSPAGEGNNFSVAFAASLVLIVIIIILNAATSIIENWGKAR